jgi:hypothetical protein
MNQQDRLICINGIDGATGHYLVPPMTPSEAVALARGKPHDSGVAGWLRRIWNTLQRPFMGLPLDVNPTEISRAGWAFVFASGTPPEIRDALEPLVARRRKQLPPDRCKVLEYRAGESMNDCVQTARRQSGDPLHGPPSDDGGRSAVHLRGHL